MRMIVGENGRFLFEQLSLADICNQDFHPEEKIFKGILNWIQWIERIHKRGREFLVVQCSYCLAYLNIRINVELKYYRNSGERIKLCDKNLMHSNAVSVKIHLSNYWWLENLFLISFTERSRSLHTANIPRLKLKRSKFTFNIISAIISIKSTAVQLKRNNKIKDLLVAEGKAGIIFQENSVVIVFTSLDKIQIITATIQITTKHKTKFLLH